MSSVLIDVEALTIRDRRGEPVVDGVGLSVVEGTTVGVVGESGSGKTTLALALMGLVRPGLELAGGHVRVDGQPILPAPSSDVRRLRRRVVSYLGQDPAGALTPTMRVCRQITERLHDPSARRADREGLVAERLAAVGLPRERDFQRRFPGQLSGGQQQRLALARALAGNPRVLLLDEPTTGLDVVTQGLVLAEIDRQRALLGLALVVISHDLAVVARLAENLLVMQDGACVDRGGVSELLGRPSHPHTAELVAACPDIHAVSAAIPARTARAGAPLLQVAGLRAAHGRRRRRVVVVDDASLSVAAGECLALVGSSGSGKTTIARCVSGLHRPETGTVALDAVALSADVRRRSAEERRRVQLIPQDPLGSLNPRRQVGDSVARPLRVLHGLSVHAARARVAELLVRVRLAPALAERYPSELSGGQRQRVAIARALAAGPDLLVCDEITSALDTSVQATVLDVLEELRNELGLGVLFVSHDLGLVARVADRVAVLDAGRILEQGAVADILTNSADERTRVLLAASRWLSAELGAHRARV